MTQTFKNVASLMLGAVMGLCACQKSQAGAEDIEAYPDYSHSKLEIRPEQKDWTLELGSGVLFNNVRTNDEHNNSTIVPINVTAALAVDDVSLDNFAGGVFRGYTDFLFRGSFDPVVSGAETYLAGFSAGPRYNFVQPGWKLVPFVEGTVGVFFTDSNPQFFPNRGQQGLGQDFNFMFGVAIGARYDFTEAFFARVSASFIHLSNAGMSEPAIQNKPIDALGPEISFGYRF